MRTVRVKVYKFTELGDKAKEKAREWWRDGQEFNAFSVEDAENVGLKITEWDTYRQHITGEFLQDADHTMSMILAEHGEMCETYKLAQQFKTDWTELVSKYSDGVKTDIVAEDNEYDFDQEADELEAEFKRELLEEYLCMIRRDYEYQESDEYIDECININEYEFTQEGKLYR